MKSRVLFVRSNPVNPDSRVEKEVLALCKNDYEVSIFAWDRTKYYRNEVSYLKLENHEIKIERVGIKAGYGEGFKKTIWKLLYFQLKIFFFLFVNRNKVDIIHACDFDTALVCFICAKLFRKKIVYDIFDFYVDCCGVPNFLRNFILKCDLYIITHADAVIICSEKRKEQIKGSIPKKLVIVENTPPKKNNQGKLMNLNKNKIKIAYVGVLLPKDRMIEDLLKIVARRKELELHIAGFGFLETVIENYSLKYENIFFYEKLSYERALLLEKSCDIMTALYNPNIKNHYYAAPNKFYEAMMLGKPLLMIKNTGMSEIVNKYNVGETIEFTAESLENGILSLVSRKKEWNEIKIKMKKLYEENFSWETMESRLIKLYEEL